MFLISSNVPERGMEGATTEKETSEEKKSDDHPSEEEEEGKKTALGFSIDYQDLPIMHWEELSLRIAELEKQEDDRRERAKVRVENDWEAQVMRQYWCYT